MFNTVNTKNVAESICNFNNLYTKFSSVAKPNRRLINSRILKNGHPTISQNVLKTRGQVLLSVMKKSSPEIKLKQHTTKAARIEISNKGSFDNSACCHPIV